MGAKSWRADIFVEHRREVKRWASRHSRAKRVNESTMLFYLKYFHNQVIDSKGAPLRWGLLEGMWKISFAMKLFEFSKYNLNFYCLSELINNKYSYFRLLKFVIFFFVASYSYSLVSITWPPRWVNETMQMHQFANVDHSHMLFLSLVDGCSLRSAVSTSMDVRCPESSLNKTLHLDKFTQVANAQCTL